MGFRLLVHFLFTCYALSFCLYIFLSNLACFDICSAFYDVQVDRKLVKQTVMTSVYGVTFIGARDQIKQRLKERITTDYDAELFGATHYAAKV